MRAKRILTVVLKGIAVLAATACLGACSREPIPFRVGIINPTQGLAPAVEGFKAGMRALGYAEGKNIEYLRGNELTALDRIGDEVKQMLAGRVDLVFCASTPATKGVVAATEASGLPVVFAPSFCPVSSGIVQSLARPGGRVTGVRVRGSVPKAFYWLRQTVPGLQRVFVPFHHADDAARLTVEDLRAEAWRFGVRLVTSNVANEVELKGALSKIPSNVQAVWLTCSHLLFSCVDPIVQAAAARRLPVVSSVLHHHKGVFLSYGPDEAKLGEQASHLADRVLRGESPGALPVEDAEQFLTINLRVEKELGLRVPELLLSQADVVER